MPPAYVTGDPGDVANLDQPDYSNDPVIPYDEDQRITSMSAPAPIVPPPPPQPAPAAPAPAPAATPNLILRGPQGPPPAVSGPPVQMMSPEQAANDFMWRRLSNTVRDLPLAETEQAVSAALRYQGQRQYQQDLASGMSPSEALAKSAPLIFSGPKQGTLGQAASMVKATRPPVTKPTAPVYRDVGGVLYKVSPDGTATAITPPKPAAAAKISPFDNEEYRSVLTQIREVQKAAENDEIGSPEFNEHQATLRNLNNQLGAIRARSQSPVTPPPAKGGSARIRVRRPDGKIGSIPADKLQSALQQGYTRLQ